jgi:hypothetical protein
MIGRNSLYFIGNGLSYSIFYRDVKSLGLVEKGVLTAETIEVKMEDKTVPFS